MLSLMILNMGNIAVVVRLINREIASEFDFESAEELRQVQKQVDDIFILFTLKATVVVCIPLLIGVAGTLWVHYGRRIEQKQIIYVIAEPVMIVTIILYNIMPYTNVNKTTDNYYHQAFDLIFGANGWIVNYLLSFIEQLIAFALLGMPFYMYALGCLCSIIFLLLQFARKGGIADVSFPNDRDLSSCGYIALNDQKIEPNPMFCNEMAQVCAVCLLIASGKLLAHLTIACCFYERELTFIFHLSASRAVLLMCALLVKIYFLERSRRAMYVFLLLFDCLCLRANCFFLLFSFLDMKMRNKQKDLYTGLLLKQKNDQAQLLQKIFPKGVASKLIKQSSAEINDQDCLRVNTAVRLRHFSHPFLFLKFLLKLFPLF